MAYIAGWEENIVNMSRSDSGRWDGVEEADLKRKTQRTTAYAVMRSRISQDLKHLVYNVRPGDAPAMYLAIHNRFCRLTTGAIAKMETELNNFSMEQRGLSIEKFVCELQAKHDHYLEVTQTSVTPQTELQLCNRLINGLLIPEFTAIKIHLQMQKARDLEFNSLREVCMNFAMDQGLLETRRGHPKLFQQSARKGSNNNNKSVCKFFKQGGHCRNGDRCPFAHKREANVSKNGDKKSWGKGKFPGSCFLCGEKGHYIQDCPKKLKSKEIDEDEKHAKEFMMKVVKQSKATSLYLGHSKDVESLVIDSGATECFCPWEDAFVPGSLKTCNIKVEIGDKKAKEVATKRGDVWIKSSKGEKLILKNVLHFPQSRFFLVSLRKFDQKGCAVRVKGGNMIIDDQDGMVLTAKLSPTTDLYHLKCSIIRSQPSAGLIVTSYEPTDETTAEDKLEEAEVFPTNTELPTVESKEVANDKSRCVHGSEEVANDKSRCVQSRNFSEQVANVLLRHNACGHQSMARVARDLGANSLRAEDLPKCDACLSWNAKAKPKQNKRGKKVKTENVLEHLQIDLGHMPVSTWSKEFYFQVVVDIHSRMVWVHLLQKKSQDLPRFQELLSKLKILKPNSRIKIVEADGQYNTLGFNDLAKKEGFELRITSAYTQKAWFAERTIGLIRRITMPQLQVAGSSLRDWGYSMLHAVQLIVEASTRALPEKVTRIRAFQTENFDDSETQEELGKEFDAALEKNDMPIWGCLCYSKLFGKNKMSPAAEPCMFLGKFEGLNGFLVRSLNTHRVYVSKNVDFDNKRFPCKMDQFEAHTFSLRESVVSEAPSDFPGGSDDFKKVHEAVEDISLPKSLTRSEMQQANRTLGINNNVDRENGSDEEEKEARPNRGYHPSEKNLENVVNESLYFLTTGQEMYPIKTPKTEREAMEGPQKESWKLAKEEEMEEIWRIETFTLVPPLHPSVRIIPSRFVYKIKWKPIAEFNALGEKLNRYEVDRFKVRWVAQGYNMHKGIDYINAYAFTIGADSDRLLLAVSVYYKFMMFTLDFKNFYLRGKMEGKPVYIKQAPGFEVAGKEDWVCQLNRALYGLPQSGKIAQDFLIEIMTGPGGFKQSISEPMIFSKRKGDKFVIAGFHVDDGKFVTNDEKMFEETVKLLAQHDLKGSPEKRTTKFLGLQYRYNEDNSIMLHQEENAEQLVASLGLQEARSVATPMETNFTNLVAKEKQTKPTTKIDFQSVCGQALWLARTRYDCCYTINNLCRAMSAPTIQHLQAAKRLGRYIGGSKESGITYHPGEGEMRTYAYVDASLHLVATTGIAVFLGNPDMEKHNNLNAAIFCRTKREQLAVVSTMEAELLAIYRGVIALQWVADLRDEIGFTQKGPGIIFTDSLVGKRFLVSDGRVPNQQTRHLRLRYEVIRQAVSHNRVEIRFVPGNLNCADVLTKPLSRELHQRHISNLKGKLKRSK